MVLGEAAISTTFGKMTFEIISYIISREYISSKYCSTFANQEIMIFDIFDSSKKKMDSSDVKEISDEMNGNNSDTSIQSADEMDDLDNLPHNLARFARSSYSRKVGRLK